jgi:hypothetical protein
VDLYYRRWGLTPAGGTLTVPNILYTNSGTVRVAGAITLVSPPAAPVGSPAAAQAMLTGPGRFVVSNALTTDARSVVDVGALDLLDASGTANVDAGGTFSPGTLTFSGTDQTMQAGLAYKNFILTGPSLTVPAGTNFNGNVDAYGSLTFAGGAIGTGILEPHRGGKVTAAGPATTDFVDFTNIYNREAASGPTPASEVDNSVAARGGGGFRYKAPGGQYYSPANTGVLTGPAPGTHP